MEDLLDLLDESELDNYTRISELIGVEFDENSVWGQLDIGELKGMLCLALGQRDEAKDHIERFLQFNDNSSERKLFYQALAAILHIEVSEQLSVDDYKSNLSKMFGHKLVQEVVEVARGELRFHGLEPLGPELSGLDKHERLIDSYKKLMKARKNR